MRGAPLSAAERLDRLRRQLTFAFAITFTPALVLLAVFIVYQDQVNRAQKLDGALRAVASSEVRLVDYSSDSIITFDGNDQDELSGQCPEWVIVPGNAKPAFVPHWSKKRCLPVRPDPQVLQRIAAQAMRGGQEAARPVTISASGRQLRVMPELFWNGPGTAWGGVALAIGDMSPSAAAHQQRIYLVAIGAVALLGASVGVGRFIAGRAIAPARRALGQQEMLLADAAHDLRTPVAALRTLAETALADPTQRSDLLPRTVQLAGRMSGIVDDLLTRARLTAGVERLDQRELWLDQLVETVLQDTPGAGEQVTADLQPTVVTADPQLLRRAFGNILDNALSHGRGAEETAHVSVTVADGTVTVTDEGPGIPDEIADKVFSRFASTGGSTGLGLAIASWVAHAHGGTLTFEPGPGGKGTTFVLNLRQTSGQRRRP